MKLVNLPAISAVDLPVVGLAVDLPTVNLPSVGREPWICPLLVLLWICSVWVGS